MSVYDVYKQLATERGGDGSFLANNSYKDLRFYTGLDGVAQNLVGASNALKRRKRQDEFESAPKSDFSNNMGDFVKGEYGDMDYAAIDRADMLNDYGVIGNLKNVGGKKANDPFFWDTVDQFDNNTYLGSILNSAISQGAGARRGLNAGLYFDDDKARAYDRTMKRFNDDQALNLTWDNLLEYITNPHGMARDTGGMIGSMASLAPEMLATSMLMPASVPAALAAGIGRFGGQAAINALARYGAPKVAQGIEKALPGMAQYGVSKAAPESLSEGGNVRYEMLENGEPGWKAALAGAATAAANAPLLAVSDTLEGGSLRGILNVPKSVLGNAAKNKLVNYGTAPLRALPNMAFSGAHEGGEEYFQDLISSAAKGELDQFEANPFKNEGFNAAFMPGMLLGGAGSLSRAVRDNNTNENQQNDDGQTDNAVHEGLMRGFEQWRGQRMDNGENGCVEAVVKMGSEYSPWLNEQWKNGVMYAPTLLANAQRDGIGVVPFDPSQLEEGDVIVYDKEGDEYDPNVPDSGNNHVVIYDGEGGYVGNSSSRQMVIQSDSYELGGGLHPARIIKTGKGGKGRASGNGIDGENLDNETGVDDIGNVGNADNDTMRDIANDSQPAKQQKDYAYYYNLLNSLEGEEAQNTADMITTDRNGELKFDDTPDNRSRLDEIAERLGYDVQGTEAVEDAPSPVNPRQARQPETQAPTQEQSVPQLDLPNETLRQGTAPQTQNITPQEQVRQEQVRQYEALKTPFLNVYEALWDANKTGKLSDEQSADLKEISRLHMSSTPDIARMQSMIGKYQQLSTGSNEAAKAFFEGQKNSADNQSNSKSNQANVQENQRSEENTVPDIPLLMAPPSDNANERRQQATWLQQLANDTGVQLPIGLTNELVGPNGRAGKRAIEAAQRLLAKAGALPQKQEDAAPAEKAQQVTNQSPQSIINNMPKDNSGINANNPEIQNGFEASINDSAVEALAGQGKPAKTQQDQHKSEKEDVQKHMGTALSRFKTYMNTMYVSENPHGTAEYHALFGASTVEEVQKKIKKHLEVAISAVKAEAKKNNLSAEERKEIAEKIISDMREYANETFIRLAKSETERIEAEEQARKEEEEARQKQEAFDTMSDYKGFGAGKPSMTRGTIRKTLSKKLRYTQYARENSLAEGPAPVDKEHPLTGVMTRAEFIEKAEAMEGSFVSTSKDKNGKTIYKLTFPHKGLADWKNSYMEITKTEYDYFQYLRKLRQDKSAQNQGNKKAADNSGSKSFDSFKNNTDEVVEMYKKRKIHANGAKELINSLLRDFTSDNSNKDYYAEARTYAKNAKADVYKKENAKVERDFKNKSEYVIRADIRRLAQEAWENKDVNDSVEFYPSKKLRQKVKDLLGHNVNAVVITSDDIRHIKNHHSEYENKRGQINLTAEHMEGLYDLINDFDEAELGKVDARGNKSIIVVRKSDSRDFAILVEKGKVKLGLKTSYRQKENPQQLSDVTSPERNVQNDTAVGFNGSSIHQNQRDVKGNVDNKKAADESGNMLSPKDSTLEFLKNLYQKPITNKATGITATFGRTGASKMISNKAVQKSKNNGFSLGQHLEAVRNIKSIFEDAELSETHPDRANDPNIVEIKRFRCDTTVGNEKAIAKITVKETVRNGHKIYSVELEALEKPSDSKESTATNPSLGSESPTPKGLQGSATSAEGPSVGSNVPQNQRDVKENQQKIDDSTSFDNLLPLEKRYNDLNLQYGKNKISDAEYKSELEKIKAELDTLKNNGKINNPDYNSLNDAIVQDVESLTPKKPNLSQRTLNEDKVAQDRYIERIDEWAEAVKKDGMSISEAERLINAEVNNYLNDKYSIQDDHVRDYADSVIANLKSNQQENDNPFKGGRSSLAAKYGKKKQKENQSKGGKDTVAKLAGVTLDYSDESIAADLEAFMREASKLSANPMFNPKLYTMGLKLGMKLVLNGVAKFDAWAKQLSSGTKNMIDPWLGSIWETINSWDSNTDFNEEAVSDFSAAIGDIYYDGTRDLKGIMSILEDDLGEDVVKEFAPVIKSAYNGISRFYADKEAEQNGEGRTDGGRGSSGRSAVGDLPGSEGVAQNGPGEGNNQLGEKKDRRGAQGERGASEAPDRAAEEAGTSEGRGPSGPGDGLGKHASKDGRGTEADRQPVSGSGNTGQNRAETVQQDNGEVSRGTDRRAAENGSGTGSVENNTEVSGRGRRDRITGEGFEILPNGNFHITNSSVLEVSGPKARFALNRQAVEAIKRHMETGEEPSPEDKMAMSQFSGWGSFRSFLFAGTYEKPAPAKGWEEEDQWLRDNLSKEEWESFRHNTDTTYYTPPAVMQKMWDLAERLGFNGGGVLEPTMGVGRFFATMPEHLQDNSVLTGVEIDKLSGEMAKVLYPDGHMFIQGYEDHAAAENTYDLAIGNVPFANVAPFDAKYSRMFTDPLLIHDFCFVKGISQLKPGGIMIAITSSNTMDKSGTAARLYMAEQAELVGAIRLPKEAFKAAGVKVDTDILVFRKRENSIDKIAALNEPWVETTTVNIDGKNVTVNKYFAEHRDMTAGTVSSETDSFGNKDKMVVHADDVAAAIAPLIKKFPKNIMRKTGGRKEAEYTEADTSVKQNGVYFNSKGDLVIRQGMKEVKAEKVRPFYDPGNRKVRPDTVKKNSAEYKAKVESLVRLNEQYQSLKEATLNNADNVEEVRQATLKAYNEHIKNYKNYVIFDEKGRAHFRPELKYLFSVGDSGTAMDVGALTMKKEVTDASGKVIRYEGRPADILLKDTVGRRAVNENPSIGEALLMQRMDGANTIDMDRLAEDAHTSKEEAIKTLIEQNAIYELPDGTYQPTDVYLSGNVVAKIKEAEAAIAQGKNSLQRNLDKLKEIRPALVPSMAITSNIGATWVPTSAYEDFFANIMGFSSGSELRAACKGNKFSITRANGAYTVIMDNSQVKSSALAVSKYGTKRKSITDILQAALNHKKVNVYDREKVDGKLEVTFNKEETEKANACVEAMNEHFNNWLWRENDQRRTEMELLYNDTMNAYVSPMYDGSFLDCPGLITELNNKAFKPRQHQSNFLIRSLVDMRGFAAHDAGTGKTLVMAMLCMEMRRTGKANKPIIFAHNANSEAVAHDLKLFYPFSNVLYIPALSKGKNSIEETQRLIAQIKTGNWDAVILPHSLIDKMAFKEETLMAIKHEELEDAKQTVKDTAELEASESKYDLDEIEDDDFDLTEHDIDVIEGKTKNKPTKNLGRATARALQAYKKIIYNIKRMAARNEDPDTISFEDTGIDLLLVDEAHVFKKAPKFSKRTVKGLDTSVSKMGTYMSFLTDYIHMMHDNKNTFLFTGTMITNTMPELHTMMRYVMPDILKATGNYNLDDFLNNFTEVVSDVEPTATGENVEVERLKKFVNVVDLKHIAGSTVDIVTTKNLPGFEARKTKSGKTLEDDTLTPSEKDELLNGRSENPVGLPYKPVKNIIIPMTRRMRAAQDALKAIAKKYEDMSDTEKAEAALTGLVLKLQNLSPALGVSIRGVNKDFRDSPNSKVAVCTRNVKEIYDSHPLACQTIFLEKGYGSTQSRTVTRTSVTMGRAHITYKAKYEIPSYNVAEDLIDRLVESGIPKNEIAVVAGDVYVVGESPASAKDKAAKKTEIADKVAAGKIRVVIGQCETLGVGVNMQENMRAIHHLDAVWQPGDLEQENRRGQRQGNKWNTCYEYRYIAQGFDGKKWSALATKKAFIDVFMDTENNTRTLDSDALGEDTSENSSDIVNTLADAVGDVRYYKLDQLKTKLQKISKSQVMFEAEKASNADRLKELTSNEIPSDKKFIADAKKDYDKYQKHKNDDFKCEIVDPETGKYLEFIDQDDALRYIENNMSKVYGTKYSNGFLKFMDFSIDVTKAEGATSFEYKFSIEGKYVCSASFSSMKQRLGNLRGLIKKREEALKEKESEAEILKDKAKAESPYLDLMKAFEKKVSDLEQDLKFNPDPPPEWFTLSVPLNTFVTYKGNEYAVTGYSTSNGQYGFVSDDEEGNTIVIPAKDAYRDNLPIFTEEELARNPKEEVYDDTDNATEDEIQAVIDEINKVFDSKAVYPDQYMVEENGTRVKKGSKKGGTADTKKANIDTATNSKDIEEFTADDYKQKADIPPRKQADELYEDDFAKSNKDSDFFKEHVLIGGIPKENYSVNSGSVNQVHSRNELKNDIKEALPGATDIVDTEAGLRLTMPNGVTVDVSIKDKITVEGEEAEKARRAHGISDDVDIIVNGYTLTGANKAFVELAQNGVEGTAFHEIFHVAYDMALTDQEKSAIDKAFKAKAEAEGKDVAEYAADCYRDWKLNKRQLRNKFKQALDKVGKMISRLCQTFLHQKGIEAHETVQDIFERIDTGEIWNRDNNPLDNFNQKFDNVDREYWESTGFTREDQEEIYNSVMREIEANRAKIERATTHEKLDAIRNTITDVRYNNIMCIAVKGDDKETYAVPTRYAMEVFENDQSVQESRRRSEETTSENYKRARDVRGLPAARDGLNTRSGAGISRAEFAASGFRISDKLSSIPANEHYVKMLDKYIQEHPQDEYTNKYYSGKKQPQENKPGAVGVGTRGKSNQSKIDKEYLSLVDEYTNAKSPESREKALNKLRNMVSNAAEQAGFADAIPEQTRAYTVRTKADPKKTIKVYKVFTLDSKGRPTALFVSSTDTLPQGVWLDANDTFSVLDNSNGLRYIPSTKNPNTKGGKTSSRSVKLSDISADEVARLEELGYISRNKKGELPKSVECLAYRPGWHAGDLPFFPQGGKGGGGKTNYKNIHRYNQVVFECEMAFDKDYTNTTTNAKGQTIFHDMQEMPIDGSYKFATNPMANAQDIGSWYISGSLKINRALTEDECNEILAKNGFKPQEWQAYGAGNDLVIGKLDLSKLGYTGEQNDAARKTLAPITYDDNGEIIPLSQRFNSSVNDVRYSVNASNSNGAIQEQEKGAFQKIADKVLNVLGLVRNKDGRIRVAIAEKDGNYISPYTYLLRSPGRIAEARKAFKPFFDMGSRATEEVVRLRTKYNRDLDKILKGINTQQKKNVYGLLWEGDATEHKYTADELSSMGYDSDEIKAYNHIRALMQRAYKMVDTAKRHIQVFPPRDITEETLNKLKRNKFVEIIRATKNKNGTWRVSWKGTSRWDHKYMDNWEKPVDVDKATADMMKSDDSIQVVWGEELKNEDGTSTGMWRLYINEEIPPVTNRKGYIPHFFHEFMIDVRDKEGTLVENMQLPIRSARTQNEAVKIAEEWLAENQLEEGQEIFIRPKVFDFSALGMKEESAAAVMGMGEYRDMLGKIAKNNGISFTDAKELVGDTVRLNSRHRFFGNLLKRKGVEGYEQDLDWVLRRYFNMASRYSALESMFKPDAVNLFERLYGDISKDHTGLAKYTKDYINDINGKPSALEQMINSWFKNSDNKFADWWRKHVASSYGDRAALQFASNIINPVSYLTLGCLNISSALLNLTQVMNSAAYIGDVSALLKVLYNGGKRSYNMRDMRILAESGVLNDIGIDSTSGYDINRGGNKLKSLKGALDNIGSKGMILFKTTEAMVRRGTVIAAYNKAVSEGKSHSQAIEFAKEVNRKSNFDYGVADAPNVFRRGSIVSQLMLQFKKYPIKELEVMADMLPFLSNKTNAKQKALFWVTYMGLCGLMGIPFIDWPDEVVSEQTGFYAKEEVQRYFMELAGKDPMTQKFAAAILYGLPGAMNINISGRAGLSDVIPSRPSDWLGATPNKAYSLVKDLLSANYANAIRDVSPGAYNIYTAAVSQQSTGYRGRVNDKYNEAWERIVRGMGFRSVDETASSVVNSIINHDKNAAKAKKEKAIDDFLNAEAEGKRGNELLPYAKELKKLGVKKETVAAEREKKKQSRMKRLVGGMKDNQKKEYKDLLNFAK